MATIFLYFSKGNLNPNKGGGGGWISPPRLWRPAVWFWMRLGMSNLHVNFIFGVYKQQRKWLWVLYKKNFEKFTFEIFFFPQNRGENFWKSNFCQKNWKQLYFFFSELNLECFQLSFDVYIVNIDKKIVNFWKLSWQNWKFSTVKLASLVQPYGKTTEPRILFKVSIGV